MQTRHILLAAALVASAALVIWGDTSPSQPVIEAVVRTPSAKPAAPTIVRTAGTKVTPVIAQLAPRTPESVDAPLAHTSEAALFASKDWSPPPAVVKPKPIEAPPPPTAPPLPFTYLGKALSAGKWGVFLARGNQTFIVNSKSVIDGIYRVEAIEPPLLKLMYLPLNQVQQLNIGAFD
jgi:hypothetical protein